MKFVFLILGFVACVAQAQQYPNKPIHVLVPFAPGGAVDTTARVLAQAMQQRVNWQFVIENRPGGNGFIATTAVAKASPDGYTLLMAHTGEFAVNPALFDNVPYELERDFLPITMVSDSPMLYLATAKAPFNTFQELVAQNFHQRLVRRDLRRHGLPVQAELDLAPHFASCSFMYTASGVSGNSVSRTPTAS